MKKLLFIFFILLFSLFSFVETGLAISVVKQSNKETMCSWANVSQTFYIKGNSEVFFVRDEFWTEKPGLISSDSIVNYWVSDNWLLSWCTSNDTWYRLSAYSPWSNTKVLAAGANCNFNKPTDKTKNQLQFVFKIKYFDISNTSWQLYPWSWSMQYCLSSNCIQDVNGQRKLVYQTKNFTNVWFTNQKTHGNECLTITLQYCWDWVRNGWEICDWMDGVPDGKVCSATCDSLKNDWWSEPWVEPPINPPGGDDGPDM